MKQIVRSWLLSACLIAISFFAVAQARPFPGPDLQQIYQHLLPQIDKIPAFDHHAHPGFSDDPDVDAMASAPDTNLPLRTRDDNPELIAAAKALFGYPYDDFSPEHAKWLVAKKTELKKQYPGTAYFNMILDKINTESSVANRAMMADYLDPKRFPWCSSRTRSCGHSITSARPRAILTKKSTSRCSRKCCTAGCSRRA